MSKLDDFLSRYTEPVPGSDCIDFINFRDKDGYGFLKKPGTTRMIRAHRYAYELAYGEIPEGMHILHHCDRPPCCNVPHLYAGTEKDNARDREERARQYRDPLVYARKLTLKDIVDIRASDLPAKLLAEFYGVHWNHINRIRCDQEFKNIPNPYRHDRRIKIIDEDVLAIYNTSGPQREIAKRFGVSQIAVSRIKRKMRRKELLGNL